MQTVKTLEEETLRLDILSDSSSHYELRISNGSNHHDGVRSELRLERGDLHKLSRLISMADGWIEFDENKRKSGRSR